MRAVLTCTALLAAAAACTVPDKVLLDGGADDEVDAAIDGADPVDPETRITSAPPAADNSTTVELAFVSDPPGATFECALDGAAAVACTSPQTYSGLADGAHNFAVRAVDAAGRRDATPAMHTWTIDSSTPDTRIDSGPTGAVANAAASFAFSSADAGAGATFECQLDGAAFAACTSPRALTGLADGGHTFAVRVRDATGNVDPTPATRTWTVDTVAPDTTIVSGPSGTVGSTAATFDFGSNENGVTFQCRLDSAAFAACNDPHTLTVAGGGHTLAVRAVDAAGNLDGSPATRTWTVDNAPPTVTIQSPTGGSSTGPYLRVDFTVSEPGTTTTCSVGGAPFAACTSGGFINVGAGSKTLTVRAVDADQNAGMASVTWTVACAAPPELPQPVARFRFEDAAGSQSIANAVAGSYPAHRGQDEQVTTNDPVTVATGRFGAGMRFTKADMDVLWWLPPAGTNGPVLTTFTVETWVKPGPMTDYVWRNGTGHLYVQAQSQGDGTTRFMSTLIQAAGGSGGSAQATPVVADQWHHVVVTYDGAQLALYVDGVKTAAPVPTAQSVQFGSFFIGNADYFETVGVQGDMDEFNIGRQVLTDAEVRARYCPAP